jgi:hypothetical protein
MPEEPLVKLSFGKVAVGRKPADCREIYKKL